MLMPTRQATPLKLVRPSLVPSLGAQGVGQRHPHAEVEAIRRPKALHLWGAARRVPAQHTGNHQPSERARGGGRGGGVWSVG